MKSALDCGWTMTRVSHMSEVKHNGRVVGLTLPYEHVKKIGSEMHMGNYSKISLRYED
jgi:hypothetical protein